MRRSWTTALLVLGLSAAASATQVVPLSERQPRMAKEPVAVPRGFVARGGSLLIHKASGTVFPPALAGFTRTSVEPFDARGHDVAVSYRYLSKGEPVVARVALLHVEMLSARDHFVSMKPLVGTYFRSLSFSNIRPTDEGPVRLEDMKKGSGYQGHFSALLGREPYELSLTTVNFGYWDVRLTAAYPTRQAGEARKHIVALVASLRETGLTRRGK